MRSNSHSKSSGRQSWRATRRHAQESSGGKHVARWSLSLLSLLLAAALGLLLMQSCQPAGNTHLATLQIPYGPGSTPPLFFADSDVDYLRQHVEQRATQVHVADPGKWIALRESASMHRLAENLADLQLSSDDRLLLYVSAHGISDQGEAYLLGNELDLKQSSGMGGAVARYPLRDFLRQLAESPGSLKLLILDWGRVRFDPRLGVIWNEFPRLLEETLQEIDDPTLWVLTSHGDIEPAVYFAEGYSLFARAVAEGLGGAADAHPRDRNVTLDELHGYVTARMEAWAYPDPERRSTSQPQLFQGGTGRVADLAAARGLKLIRVRSHSADSVAEKSGQGGSPGESGAEGEAGGEPSSEPGILDRVAAEVGRELGSEVRSVARRNSLIAQGEYATSRTRSNLAQLRRALPPPVEKTAASEPTTSDSSGSSGSGGPSEQTAPAKEGDASSEPGSPDGQAGTVPPADPQPPPLADLLAQDGLELATLTESDQTILEVLHRAWWLRDQLHHRRNPLKTSPVDFAPHRWRTLNARILQAEQQFLAGNEPEELTDGLLRLLGELEELRSVLASDTPGRSTSGGSSGSWRAAWNAYRNSPEFLVQHPDDERLQQGVEAERLLRLSVFELPWIVEWQARELASNNQLGQSREFRDLVNRCRDLQQLLDSLSGQPLEDSGLERLRDQQRQLTLAGDALRESLDRRLRDGLRTQHPTLRQRQLLTTLGSPYFMASQRSLVLAQLLQPVEDQSVGDDWRLSPPTQPRWSDTENGSRQLSMLTRDILELAGPLDLSDRELSASSESLRAGGERLRERLADCATPAARSLSPSLTGSSDPFRPLLLADARDLLVENVYPRSGLLPPARPSQLRLGVVAPFTLSVDRWERLTLPILAEGEVGDELSVTLQFPTDRLQFADGNGPPPATSDAQRLIRPRQPMTLNRSRSESEVGWQLPLYVRAVTNASPSVDRAQLEITLSTTGVPPRTELLGDWQLPSPPNLVRLRVRREGAGFEQELPVGIRLRPHPNRQTGYEFFLVNDSLRSRQVHVEVFRVPRGPATIRRAPGRFFDGEVFDDRFGRLVLTADDRVRPDLQRTHRVLATREPVSLAGNLEEVRIPLVASSAANSPGDATSVSTKEEGADSSPSTSPSAPVSADITHGLLCVITDSQRPEEQWLQWLEIYPLAPRNYLQADARYEQGRIYVRVSLPENDHSSSPTPLGEEGAIPIFLHSTDTTSEANQAARIESRVQPPVEVWIAAPQDERQRTVWLDVDGVPRAFAFDVLCRTGARGEDLLQKRWQLEIRRLATDPDPEKFRDVTRNREQPMAFRENSQLWVELHVDMPVNAFEGAAHQDLLEVGLEEETPRVFYSDRDHRVLLKDVQGGAIVLETKVTDHRHPLDITGRRGEVRVVARGNYQGSEERDSVPVVLDGTPPGMPKLSFAGTSVSQGTKLPVGVAADDGTAGSGIAFIRVGFDRNGNGQLDDADEPVVLEQNAGRVELDTAELRVGRTYRVLAEAVDRVGFVSPLMEKSIQILPEKMPEKEEAPKKGDIRGRVLFNGVAPVSRNLVTVTIEGAGIPPVKTGAGGSYLFRDVPAGTYTLKATGSFTGSVCVGELKDVVVPTRGPVDLPVARP